MIDFELEVKNYRCFPDSNPLRLAVRSGFTSVVGINNAGKSSILRFFYEFRNLFNQHQRESGNLIGALKGEGQAIGSFSVAAGEEVYSKLNPRDIEVRLTWLAPPASNQAADPIEHQIGFTFSRPTPNYVAFAHVDGRRLDAATGSEFLGSGQLRIGQDVLDLSPFFEACRFMGQALYLGPFRNTINVGASERYYDMAVGQQFTTDFQNFKSGGDSAANEAIYQLTQDIKRIFGFEQLEINPDPERKTLQLMIDGRSFRLSELGAGIAQFILVLANVLVRRPSVVLIDEPEANLHPSLQLDFLTTLASYSADASVMFATHNLGLARAASEAIYSCKRLSLGVSEVRPLEATPHLGEFLGELGFSAYRDLGFNSILLVEGPSDVKVFQQFLRRYKKDHEIVILPLGGSSMINGSAEAELNEIARIHEKISVVIDSERTAAGDALSKDRQDFVDVCKKLGLDVCVLDRRATENYFSDSAVKTALGNNFSALQSFELLKDATPGWSKRDNWRIARQLKLEEFEATDLGKFVSAL